MPEQKNIPSLHPLSQFNPIGLDELNEANLQNRTDTKFLLDLEIIPELLEFMKAGYDVVEIDGLRSFLYRSQYFDTDNFDMYRMHQRGFKKRHKVRIRNYNESGLYFFEVKKKRKGRTIKVRQPIGEFASKMEEEMRAFYADALSRPLDLLSPKIHSNYYRSSFVSKNKNERVTLDQDLRYIAEKEEYVLPNKAILEVKQDGVDRNSGVYSFLKKRGIRPIKFSKYCLGASLLNPTLKRNKIKRSLALFERQAI